MRVRLGWAVPHRTAQELVAFAVGVAETDDVQGGVFVHSHCGDFRQVGDTAQQQSSPATGDATETVVQCAKTPPDPLKSARLNPSLIIRRNQRVLCHVPEWEFTTTCPGSDLACLLIGGLVGETGD